MTATVLNTKISDAENKIPDPAKYIITQEFNKLTAENFKERLKSKADFDYKLIIFNRKITSNKANSLITKDYNFLSGRIYFASNDGSKNTFVYQPTLNKLELKKTRVLIMFLVANQREYTFLNVSHYILLSCIRMGIKFDKDLLAVKQSNYLTKIVNVYIVCDLDTWPRNPTNNFNFKNCLFGATYIFKNSDKEKYVCSGYGTTFDSAGSWTFNNATTRNAIIFGVDNSSSSHSDNRKNNFLVVDGGQTFRINESFGSPEKKFSINFSKVNTKFCLSFHYNANNSVCLLMENKSLNLKSTKKS